MFAELMASSRDADAQAPATPPRAPIFAKKGSTLTTPVGRGDEIDSV
jgi:hypothetical protein